MLKMGHYRYPVGGDDAASEAASLGRLVRPLSL